MAFRNRVTNYISFLPLNYKPGGSKLHLVVVFKQFSSIHTRKGLFKITVLVSIKVAVHKNK